MWRFLPENGTDARHIFTTFGHGNLRVYTFRKVTNFAPRLQNGN